MNDSTLKVSTESLKDLANYLTTSVNTLNGKLEELSTKMSSLNSSWLDKDGISYVSKFDSFITNSKNINKEISGLGEFANNMADSYESILRNHLSRM